MDNFELISFVTPEQLAEAVAGEWLQQLSSAVPAKARYPVALSGGRIARQFYSAIAHSVTGWMRLNSFGAMNVACHRTISRAILRWLMNCSSCR